MIRTIASGIWYIVLGAQAALRDRAHGWIFLVVRVAILVGLWIDLTRSRRLRNVESPPAGVK